MHWLYYSIARLRMTHIMSVVKVEVVRHASFLAHVNGAQLLSPLNELHYLLKYA